MTKRKHQEYLDLLYQLKSMPIPGTILHSPDNKDYKLLGYNISIDGYNDIDIYACIEKPTNPSVELEWTLDEVEQCTWEYISNELCPTTCPYLNMTEEQQQALGEEGKYKHHMCTKYNVMLYHMFAHPRIYKCEECYRDMNYIEGTLIIK